MTQRIKRPFSADQAEEVIDRLSVLPVQEIDLPVVRREIDIYKKYQISYRDSLLLAAAERA